MGVATAAAAAAPAAVAAPAATAIDREKHCPFLLRVFCNVGSHNKREAYEQLNERPMANELHIYTWPDATLREVADLVMDANADARNVNARMGFSVVTQERNGRMVFRKAGWVYSNRRKTVEEDKTLESLRFQPGDYFDVAILQ